MLGHSGQIRYFSGIAHVVVRFTNKYDVTLSL